MSLKAFDFDSTLAGLVILIVEDEIPERQKYEDYATRLGMCVAVAANKLEAIKLIDDQAIDYACCDLHLSTAMGRDAPDGLDVIKRLSDTQRQTVIVAMSSDPRRDMGDKALAAGAQHFARKPFQSIEDFKISLRLASQRHTLRKNTETQTREKNQFSIFGKYPDGIVVSSETRKVLDKLATRPDVFLNLYGETGTGKEEIAKIYHKLRCDLEGPIPLITVNCAQLNSAIVDSELFGHKKGSFTGANESTVGYIGEAHGGILFLDEIHTLDSQIQNKLLRVLNDGSYTRVGEVRQRSAKFQLITASTKDLEEEAIAGRFAMDLKMRIDGYPLFLPALRERKQDIPDLLRVALARNSKMLSEEKIEEISAVLAGYHWSGNIRQFFKITSAWLLHCDIYDLPLESKHIPVSQTMRASPIKPSHDNSSPSSHTPARYRDTANLVVRALQEDRPIEDVLSEIERNIISEALGRHKTISDVCVGLSISRSSLDARRRKYNMIHSDKNEI